MNKTTKKIINFLFGIAKGLLIFSAFIAFLFMFVGATLAFASVSVQYPEYAESFLWFVSYASKWTITGSIMGIIILSRYFWKKYVDKKENDKIQRNDAE
jgi:hypothetical protein